MNLNELMETKSDNYCLITRQFELTDRDSRAGFGWQGVSRLICCNYCNKLKTSVTFKNDIKLIDLIYTNFSTTKRQI